VFLAFENAEVSVRGPSPNRSKAMLMPSPDFTLFTRLLPVTFANRTYAASQSAGSAWISSTRRSGFSTVTATAIATRTSPAPMPNARW
jgi:hypothetical protein